MLAAGQQKASYPPQFVLKDEPLGVDLPADAPTDIVAFISTVRGSEKRSGTLVRMRRFTSNQPITADEVRAALVAKFTVVLARTDFEVSINGVKIDPAAALPEFEFRIPAINESTETLSGGEVRFWVGFISSAEWAADQAGVGVFAHGKSAQDRPFFFGAKGKEVLQRYMYGVVEADWLDELEADLISTDRSSLDWLNPDAAELYEWGRKKVNSWLSEYAAVRATKHGRETRLRAEEQREARVIPRFSVAENEQIDQLVSDATSELGRNQAAVTDELLDAVSQAWINLPSRRLLTELWAELGSAGRGTREFVTIAAKLREHSVPEAMGLAMTFAQRAYALSLLQDLVNVRSERNLQELIEAFPWIVQPRGDLLTADRQLKTTLEKAALNEGDGSRIGRAIRAISDAERADFVFLTDANKREIQIIELKAPAIELTLDHDRQLRDYLDFVQTFRDTARVTGVLIGNPGRSPLISTDTRITVKGWTDILLECRAAYVQMLAAMLEQADPAADDARMKLVVEFGGEPVWEMLREMAKTDEALAELMTRFAHLEVETTSSD